MRVLLSLVMFAALALISCGGGNDREGVENLLDRAFSQEIESADLEVEATLQLKGSDALDRPVRLEASGPFRTNEGKLPSVDVDLRVATAGGGQTVQTGFLSTGDRAFIKFQDVYYEQPAAQVRRANESIRKNQKGTSSLRALGLDPRSWLAEAKEEGEAEVSGVKTRHVSGTLEVTEVVDNINEFVKRSAAALGGATGQQAPEPLSKKDIREISEVVKDPTFDVYVGKEDDTIRRVSGRLEFDVPEGDRSSLGLEGGSLEFSIEFSDVNGDQRIEAPANARPLSSLTRSLGGGSVLGGSVDSGSGQSPGTGANDDGTVAPPATGGSAAPDAEDFGRYAECLDEARPEDTEALQRCAKLLTQP